jgi:uncharacterized DUF497 family protein
MSNLTKHGIDFFLAWKLFDGRPVIVSASTRSDELRYATTGEISGRYYTFVWTPRGDAIRIISARRARYGEEQRHRSIHGA